MYVLFEMKEHKQYKLHKRIDICCNFKKRQINAFTLNLNGFLG